MERKSPGDLAAQAADEIAQERRKALEAAGVTFKKIAREFSFIAFSRIDDYVSIAEDGEVQAIPLDRITKRKIAAVKKVRARTSITESKDGEQIYKTSQIEYELYDKVEVLKYLCRIGGYEPAEKHDLNHAGTVTIRIKGKDEAE